MGIVVITANGLNTHFLGCYGNEWMATPHLDTLAAESIVFDGHIADQPDRSGAWRAWRTGCFDIATTTALPKDLFQELGDRGVANWLLTSNAEMAPSTNSWQKIIHTTPDALFDKAVKALQRLADKGHFLLWIDVDALHPPWRVECESDEADCEELSDELDADQSEDAYEPWTEALPDRIDRADDHTFLRIQRTFGSVVSTLDAEIGRFLEPLREAGVLDDLSVIFTSGYGMALGEHEETADQFSHLHEETIHVPLIYRLPKRRWAGQRVFRFTQSVDLVPTCYAALDLPLPICHGSNVLEDLPEPRSAAFSARCCPSGTAFALRTAERAFLEVRRSGDDSSESRLFLKPDDRWEVNNVAAHFPDEVDALREQLLGFTSGLHRR